MTDRGPLDKTYAYRITGTDSTVGQVWERFEVQEYDQIPPFLEMGTLMAEEFFVQLVDELWAQGIRPSDKSNQKELDAVRYHLEDLRTIAKVK
jgi:hypothetical protein